MIVRGLVSKGIIARKMLMSAEVLNIIVKIPRYASMELGVTSVNARLGISVLKGFARRVYVKKTRATMIVSKIWPKNSLAAVKKGTSSIQTV